jgi:hypothetical protein
MQLVVQSGSEPGRVYEVTSPGQRLIVGRQSGNDIVVPDEQVSRKHAQIEERGGTLVITDMDSSNGTFVNGTRISSTMQLRNGDMVQVGTTVMKVVDAGGNGDAGATMRINTSEVAASAAADAMAGGQQAFATYKLGDAPPAQNYDYNQNYNSPPPPPAPSENYAPGGGLQMQQNYQDAPPQNYGGYQPQPGQQPPQGQPGQPGYEPAPAWGQPPNQVAKKGGLPLPVLIGLGAAVLVLIAAVVAFVVLGGSGAGDLPAPRNSTKLDLSVADLAKLPGNSNLNTNGIKVAAYKTKETPQDLVNFYKNELVNKGWREGNNTQVAAGVGSLLLTKDSQSAQVVALTLTSQQQIDALATSIPPLKDKLQAGDTLVLVAQGPTNALATPGA